MYIYVYVYTYLALYWFGLALALAPAIVWMWHWVWLWPDFNACLFSCCFLLCWYVALLVRWSVIMLVRCFAGFYQFVVCLFVSRLAPQYQSTVVERPKALGYAVHYACTVVPVKITRLDLSIPPRPS